MVEKPVEEPLEVAELRHRLQNNLQLLQALVTIRLRNVTDPESRRHLTWLTDVIAALGLMNQRLGARPGAAFHAYLEEAVSFWRRVCADRDIEFSLNAEPLDVPGDAATSLALIVHELVANAVEHAFSESGGRVRIDLVDTGGELELTVADNGSGLDPKTPSEGLSLVRGLADHLGGAFHLKTGDGVIARVRLPNAPSRRPH